MDKVIKTFISEIKSVNEKDFTLEAVVSDETVDRYGEVIKIDAWKKRLGRYKAQPVLLSSHRYDKLTNQIGKAEKIYTKDGQLIAKFKYFHGEGNEEADWAWKLASKFGMAAYSVGFLPYKADDKEYDEDVKAGKKAWREYTDVELLEISQVLIPANPSAMMKSFEDEEDEVVKNYIEMVHKEFKEEEVEFVELINEDLEVKDVEESFKNLAVKVASFSLNKETDLEKYLYEYKNLNKDIPWIKNEDKWKTWNIHCSESKTVGNLARFDKELFKNLFGIDLEYFINARLKYLAGDIETKPETTEICDSISDKEDKHSIDEYEEKKKKPCGKIFTEEEMNEIMEKLVSLEEKVDTIVERYAQIDKEDEEFTKMLEEDEVKDIEDAKIEDENYIKSLLEDSLKSLNKALGSVQQK